MSKLITWDDEPYRSLIYGRTFGPYERLDGRGSNRFQEWYQVQRKTPKGKYYAVYIDHRGRDVPLGSTAKLAEAKELCERDLAERRAGRGASF